MTQEVRKPRESLRDRLIGTALSLFSRYGFHATGIDTILAETGVAKMTLYKHFASKDALILAALERQGAEFRGWLTERVNVSGRAPRDRLLAAFTAVSEWCANPQYTGCIFVNAAAEFHRADDPIHLAASRQKRWIQDFLCASATESGARNPESLASQLCVLMDGAFTLTHVSGSTEPVRQAAAAARILIDGALAKTDMRPSRQIRKRVLKSPRRAVS